MLLPTSVAFPASWQSLCVSDRPCSGYSGRTIPTAILELFYTVTFTLSLAFPLRFRFYWFSVPGYGGSGSPSSVLLRRKRKILFYRIRIPSTRKPCLTHTTGFD